MFAFVSRRTASMLPRMGVRAKHTLPELPYSYGALEPAISGQIMEVHHAKHHQTYVNGLNNFETQTAEALAKGDVKKAISLQRGLNFNGCLLYTSPSPRDVEESRMPSSA